MDKDTVNKALELLPEVYRDVAQPGVQKLGLAISSLIGVLTGPIIIGSNIAEKNLVALIRRLDKEDEGSIVPIPPELGVPILEKLRYTRGEELAKLYIELFAKASLDNSQNKAHPSYFEVLTNISVDEAKILGYLSEESSLLEIPYIRVKSEWKDKSGDVIVAKYVTLLASSIDFFTPENEQMYLENLSRLGILHDFETRYLTDDKKFYSPLRESSSVKKLKEEIEAEERVMQIEKAYFVLTSFGINFIETCVPNNKFAS